MSGSTSKDPVIVVVQLSGGNDYMNTVVPHSNSLYRDYRPSVNINETDVIELTSEIGFHPGITLCFSEIDDNIVKTSSGFWYLKN